MNALCRCKQRRFGPAIGMIFTIIITLGLVVTSGCRDLTSQNEPPALNTLTSGVPTSGEPDVVTPEVSVDAAEPTTPAPPIVPAPDRAPKQSIAIPATPPDEIYEPKVVLSRAHEKTCLVKVGETMPELELVELGGKHVTLDALRGDGLTVVVFWANQVAFGREQVDRLAAEVALPFRHLGVKVVAVNVGDPVEQVELDAVTREEVSCVLDPDGSAVAKVATSKLPRTYLIDAEGRVLWFDIEYSRTTCRQLKNAIFYFSREPATEAS